MAEVSLRRNKTFCSKTLKASDSLVRVRKSLHEVKDSMRVGTEAEELPQRLNQDCNNENIILLLNQLSCKHGFGALIFAVMSQLYNLDPFNVYKKRPGLERAAKTYSLREDRILIKPELRIRPIAWDGWRKRLSMFLIIWSVFVVSWIIIEEILLLKHFERYPCKRKSTVSNDGEADRFMCKFERFTMGIMASDMDKALLTFMGLSCAIVQYSIATLEETTGYNAAPVRFFWSPKREQIRMDLLTKDLIEEVRTSQNFFRAQMFGSIRSSCAKKKIYISNADQTNHQDMTRELKSLSFIMELLEDDRRQIEMYSQDKEVIKLRPEIYQAEWYRYTKPLLNWVYISELLVVEFFIVVFVSTVVNHSINMSKVPHYEFRHILYLIEITGLVQQTGNAFIVTSMVGISIYIYYLKLLRNSSEELQIALVSLRQIRDLISDLRLKTKTESEFHESCVPPFSSKKSVVFMLKLEANRIASDLLLKFMIHRHELRNMAHTLSACGSLLLIVIIAAISCVLFMEFYRLDGIFFGRYFVLPSAAVVGNSLAILYALSSERVAQLERLSWSILAQMVFIANEEHDDIGIWGLTGGLGFSSFIWRRHVCKSEFWKIQLVPRPFGITINYHRILEANFFFISIATIFIIR